MLDRPALNLAIVADEPEAAAVVPVLDRAGLDRRAINRKAVKHWATIRDMIVDQNGRSLITFLDPTFKATDPNVGRPYGVPDPRPQIKELRGPSLFETEGAGGPGAWVDYGTGKQGPGCISLIEMLGMCSRDVATTYLRELVDRIVEIKP
jgi:hypothetical protein